MNVFLCCLLLLAIVALVRGRTPRTSENSLEGHISPSYDDEDYVPLKSEDQLPKILNSNSVITAVQGDNVTLPCDVIRLENHSVIWTKKDSIIWVLQGQPVLIQYVVKDKRIGRYNTSLVIHDVNNSDEGLYACALSIKPDQQIFHDLEINVPPKAAPRDSVDFVQESKGAKVELRCSVEGKPTPSVTWERENGEPMNGIPNDTSYIIKNIKPEDAGVYICIASNGIGEDAKARIILNVHYPPVVNAVHKIIHTGVNYDAILFCNVQASPFPKIVWLKEEAPVNPMRLRKGIEKGKERIDYKFSLNFEKVIRSDFGNYSCTASNFWGNGSDTMELTGRPLIPVIKSSPKGALTDQYTLSWKVKCFSPVIYYDVFFRNVSENNEENWANVTIPGSSRSSIYHNKQYILRDLRPGFPIEAKVRAINEFGTSGWSDHFQFLTFDPGESLATVEENEENIQMEEPVESMRVPKLKLNDAEGSLSSATALIYRSNIVLIAIILSLLR